MIREVTEEERKLFREVVDNLQIVILRPRYDYRPTILDLHGISVQSAYDYTYQFIYESYIYNIKCITIITGKSGEICFECIRWLNTEKFVKYIRKIEILNGGGALRIFLKKI